MSGHSKWATIHRQKGIKDAVRGQLFSKLARAITIATKMGGGESLDGNYRLKIIIDKARVANMPKENIERAISKGQTAEELFEITYEGFGPSGVGILVEAATDNKNRTSSEIKNIFEKGGGSLAGPGAVSFNFKSKEMLVVEKQTDTESQMLSLIDLRVDDVEEVDGALDIYVEPSLGRSIKEKVESLGMKVISSELIQKPVNFISADEKEITKIMSLLEDLNNHGDVQKVFANI